MIDVVGTWHACFREDNHVSCVNAVQCFISYNTVIKAFHVLCRCPDYADILFTDVPSGNYAILQTGDGGTNGTATVA